MKYRVLKNGLSQRTEDGEMVDRKVGELIDVSAEAAESLVKEGFIEPAADTKRKRSDHG
jgi:hypothetical protein